MRSVEENFEIPNNITYIFSIPLLDEIDIAQNKSDFIKTIIKQYHNM